MPKLIVLVARPDGYERAALQQRVLSDVAPALLDTEPAPQRLSVNLVDVEPPQGAPQATEAPYDAVVEAWFAEPEAAFAWLPRLIEALRPATATAYHVAERVQLDDGHQRPPGERSPGIKAIFLVRRHAWLSDEEAKQRWRQHAPLAKQYHTGMTRYAQNGVIAALTPDAPLVHGIAELYFPTREDLEQRLYDSASGREAIAADTASLVAETVPLYTSEYILSA